MRLDTTSIVRAASRGGRPGRALSVVARSMIASRALTSNAVNELKCIRHRSWNAGRTEGQRHIIPLASPLQGDAWCRREALAAVSRSGRCVRDRAVAALHASRWSAVWCLSSAQFQTICRSSGADTARLLSTPPAPRAQSFGGWPPLRAGWSPARTGRRRGNRVSSGRRRSCRTRCPRRLRPARRPRSPDRMTAALGSAIIVPSGATSTRGAGALGAYPGV